MFNSSARPIALIFVASLAGCGGEDKTSKPEPAATVALPRRNEKIPIELSYPIIEEWEDLEATPYRTAPTRHSTTVRLNMKVSRETLKELALEIKSHEKRQFERTLIWYRLPKFDPREREYIWATTHFDPVLKVEINGFDIETENALKGLTIDHKGKAIGSWLIEGQYSGRVVMIYEDGDTLHLAEVYSATARHDSELVEIPSSPGRRFKQKGGGDIYAIDDRDVLRVYSGEGSMLHACPKLK